MRHVYRRENDQPSSEGGNVNFVLILWKQTKTTTVSWLPMGIQVQDARQISLSQILAAQKSHEPHFDKAIATSIGVSPIIVATRLFVWLIQGRHHGGRNTQPSFGIGQSAAAAVLFLSLAKPSKEEDVEMS